METTYIFKSKNTHIEYLFKYDLEGHLTNLQSTGEPPPDEQWNWFVRYFPFNYERIAILASDANLRKYFSIEKTPASVTFEDFWNEYGKIGTKSVAKKKFDKLKPEEVIKAFIGVEKERSKKKLDNTAMPYAETYLNQKRWEVWITRAIKNEPISKCYSANWLVSLICIFINYAVLLHYKINSLKAMPLKTPHKKQGYQRNQLLRYKAVMDEFNRHDYRYMPISVIWREFIYPKFFISRGTLYKILSIDIDTELQAYA